MKKILVLLIILFCGCDNKEYILRGKVYNYDHEFQLLAVVTVEEEVYWMMVEQDLSNLYEKYSPGYYVEVQYTGKPNEFVKDNYDGLTLVEIIEWQPIKEYAIETKEWIAFSLTDSRRKDKQKPYFI